jgi:2-dehydro-3-deoxyglucarate aldolase/4-hydroxy-2-oxoheptanedioate aldolase
MIHQPVFENKIKRELKAGRKVVGAWAQLASPFSAEIMARAGFDFLMIDMEHAPGDCMTLAHQCMAMGATDSTPLVRAPWNDMVAVKRILDSGAQGVLVPYVNTREEAEAAVAAAKYPPQGVRGVAASPRAPGYGLDSLKNYLAPANDQTLVLTAAETPAAVSHIDEILRVEGLDGIFIGPMDLATSMGHFCDPGHKEVQEAIAVIEKKVKGSGKALATLAGSSEDAQAKFGRGYQMLMVMSDSVTLGQVAAEKVAAFRKLYPQG